MQRANIIISIFWIGLLAVLVYIVNDNFSKFPNEKSKSVTAIIPEYPNYTYWQISNEKNYVFTTLQGAANLLQL